jgi:hypothetical protein
MPATMPKASSPDETARARDHLALGELEERRRQRDARNEDDERSDHGAQARVGDVVLHRERDDRRDARRCDERHERLDRPPVATEPPQDADEGAQHRSAGDVTRRRVENQREPDGQHGIAHDARDLAEPVVHRANLVEPLDPRRRGDDAPFGLGGESWTAAIWSRRGVAESRVVGSIVAALP